MGLTTGYLFVGAVWFFVMLAIYGLVVPRMTGIRYQGRKTLFLVTGASCLAQLVGIPLLLWIVFLPITAFFRGPAALGVFILLTPILVVVIVSGAFAIVYFVLNLFRRLGKIEASVAQLLVTAPVTSLLGAAITVGLIMVTGQIAGGVTGFVDLTQHYATKRRLVDRSLLQARDAGIGTKVYDSVMSHPMRHARAGVAHGDLGVMYSLQKSIDARIALEKPRSAAHLKQIDISNYERSVEALEHAIEVSAPLTDDFSVLMAELNHLIGHKNTIEARIAEAKTFGLDTHEYENEIREIDNKVEPIVAQKDIKGILALSEKSSALSHRLYSLLKKEYDNVENARKEAAAQADRAQSRAEEIAYKKAEPLANQLVESISRSGLCSVKAQETAQLVFPQVAPRAIFPFGRALRDKASGLAFDAGDDGAHWLWCKVSNYSTGEEMLAKYENGQITIACGNPRRDKEESRQTRETRIRQLTQEMSALVKAGRLKEWAEKQKEMYELQKRQLSD